MGAVATAMVATVRYRAFDEEENSDDDDEEYDAATRSRREKAESVLRRGRANERERKGRSGKADSSDSETMAAIKRVKEVPQRSPPRYARRKAAPAVFKDISSDDEAF